LLDLVEPELLELELLLLLFVSMVRGLIALVSFALLRLQLEPVPALVSLLLPVPPVLLRS